MALKKIVESETKNVAVLQIPASQLLDFIKTGSIDKIFLNFSDPWPKKRYHKRRLVHPNHLTIFEQCLKKSGQIVLKTDNQELYFYALEMFQQRNYQLLEVNPNYQLCEGDFMSEYEKRFRSLNQPIYRIVAKIN